MARAVSFRDGEPDGKLPPTAATLLHDTTRPTEIVRQGEAKSRLGPILVEWDAHHRRERHVAVENETRTERGFHPAVGDRRRAAAGRGLVACVNPVDAER